MLFREYKIHDDIIYTWQVNKLILKIKKHGNEWFVYDEYVDKTFENVDFTESPLCNDDLKWIRVIAGKNTDSIKITPFMPDRPVVLKLSQTLRIAERQKNVFYTTIPLGLKVTLLFEESEQFLCECQSEILSNTWFGDMYTGILSYTVEAGVYNDISVLDAKEYHVIAPVSIRNKIKKYFDFTRFSIYAYYLNIYKSNEKMWNNETIITCIDENKINILVNEKKPLLDHDLTLFVKSKYNYDKSIVAKSINVFFKSISGDE